MICFITTAALAGSVIIGGASTDGDYYFATTEACPPTLYPAVDQPGALGISASDTEPANGANGPGGNACKIAVLQHDLAIAQHAKPKDVPSIPNGCANG